MTFFNRLSFLFLFTLFTLHAAAQSEKREIKKESETDKAYDACIEIDTSYANICNCAFVAYGKWNGEMEDTYKRLLRNLKEEKDKTALRESQTAWIAFRDAQFASFDNMFNHPGSKWCTIRQDGRIDIVRARAQQLEQYDDDLKKHDKDYSKK